MSAFVCVVSFWYTLKFIPNCDNNYKICDKYIKTIIAIEIQFLPPPPQCNLGWWIWWLRYTYYVYNRLIYCPCIVHRGRNCNTNMKERPYFCSMAVATNILWLTRVRYSMRWVKWCCHIIRNWLHLWDRMWTCICRLSERESNPGPLACSIEVNKRINYVLRNYATANTCRP